MKAFLLLLLLFSTVSAFAQSRAAQTADTIRLPIDPATQLITYSVVEQQPGASQAELYARAKFWLTSVQPSLLTEEKESSVVQGTCSKTIVVSTLGNLVPQMLLYTVKIAAKDGRYRYEVSNFRFTSITPARPNDSVVPLPAEIYTSTVQKKGAMFKIAQSAQVALRDAYPAIATSLKAGMAKPATGTSAGKTDW